MACFEFSKQDRAFRSGASPSPDLATCDSLVLRIGQLGMEIGQLPTGPIPFLLTSYVRVRVVNPNENRQRANARKLLKNAGFRLPLRKSSYGEGWSDQTASSVCDTDAGAPSPL